ncbi:outer membrane protein assembly factor BamC [Vibrio algicola]|uniref:Outer membrane protein assembly factor BamC n=1 Tax=Vibrio algicola TaxID=2662262 RepID=A0A5Q0THE9_9VIBR|nr:outer membrane protein assembly factor BamC [Vibrio algicola]
MKFSHQLVLSSLAVLVLSACSGDPASRRQAKDDFKYLDTKLDQQWVLQADAQPQFYPQYNIPQGDFKGATGRDVDIRPPQEVLELIPGARVERSDNSVILWLVSKDELDKIWGMIHTTISDKKIKLRQDTPTSIETDWVDLSAQDESFPIAARYKIDRIEQNNRYAFQVTLVQFRENNKELDLTPEIEDRYSSNMVNNITNQYDKQVTEEARIRALELLNKIPVTMGKDRSGLPVIIARAPYDVMWSKFAGVLPLMGFTVDDKNQSQGTVETKYEALDDEVWSEINIRPLSIKDGKYTFLVGDLDNRTSINVTDSKGKPIPESDMESFIPALQAYLDNNSKASQVAEQEKKDNE